MKKIIIIITCFIGLSGAFAQQREIFHNPVIEADVPDPSMIRGGKLLLSGKHHHAPDAGLSGDAFKGLGALGNDQLCVSTTY